MRKKKSAASLPLLNPDRPQECLQCGHCCRIILLGLSPRDLRAEYDRWLCSSAPLKGGETVSDIHLIYPMLVGTCRGVWVHPDTKERRYVYGPCRHLGRKGKKAICRIHGIRGGICRNYPYYRQFRQLEIAAQALGPNPGYIRGCGYNASKKDGHRPAGFVKRKLIPLMLEEQEVDVMMNTKIVKASRKRADRKLEDTCKKLEQPKRKAGKRRGKTNR